MKITRTLPAELEIDGFDLKQLKRDGDVALYSQSKGGKVVAYELIVIKASRGFESYPRSDEWGENGWSIASLEDALNRFLNLSSSRKPNKSHTL